MYLWLILVVLVSFYLYKCLTRNHDRWEKVGIPDRKPIPFLGTIGTALVRRLSLFDAFLGHYKYFKSQGHRAGGLMMMTRPSLLVLDPELLKLIQIKDFDYFPNHRQVTGLFDELFMSNLFNLRDQKWKDMRSVLSPAFTASKMKNMFPFVNKCSIQLMDHIAELCLKGTGTAELEMKGLFARYANDVIASTAFGLEVNSLSDPNNEFYKNGQEMTNFTSPSKLFLFMLEPLLPKWVRINILPTRTTQFFHKIIQETIKSREEMKIVRPDMIHLLMQAKKGTLEDETTFSFNKNKLPELTDVEISAQAIIFFMAGFDTVSSFLSFASYELALNADIQQRLYDEIEKVIKEDGGNITYESVMNKMTYLDMVYSETLRRWPLISASEREVAQDYTFPDTKDQPKITLHKGEVVQIPVVGLHLDPEYFPNPLKFDPERFNEENKNKIIPMTYSPFGHGPRSCIGNRLALMEGKVCLVHLLRKFEFLVIKKTDIPLKYKSFSVLPSTENGVWIGLKPRHK